VAGLGPSLGWGLLVGASLLAGALVAVGVRLPPRVAGTVTAFGGGVLLAAVAFELVPEADEDAGRALTAAGLVAGTLVLVGADAWLSRDPGMREMRRAGHAAAAGRPMQHAEAARGEAIAAGLVVDGVPESIALGLTIAEGELGVALLVGIVVGNVVEAYGAARRRKTRALRALRFLPVGGVARPGEAGPTICLSRTRLGLPSARRRIGAAELAPARTATDLHIGAPAPFPRTTCLAVIHHGHLPGERL
jgi:zinc transporter ZupT